MGVSYIIGSIFPLIAYFFLPIPCRVASLARADGAGAGDCRHYQGAARQHQSGADALEVVVVGTASALGGLPPRQCNTAPVRLLRLLR